jgi:hypothetical protein
VLGKEQALNDLVYVGPVKRGRPSTYSLEVADAICERLCEGESLLSITRDEDMPSYRTVMRWADDIPEFSAEYARARAVQADHEAQEIKEIADDKRHLPEERRIMVDARKWRAERMGRRLWGAKVEHEHKHSLKAALPEERLPRALGFLAEGSGGDGDGPDAAPGEVGDE